MKKKICQYFGGVILLLVVGCNARQAEVVQPFYENTAITKKIAVDSSSNIAMLVKEYKKGLEAIMNEVVGFSGMYMPIDKPQSLLSNMVADFTYKLGKQYCQENKLPYEVDAAVINIRGLRKSMPKGNITLGDIYEISPFENKLFIVAMYGKDLRKLFDHITRSGGEGVGNIRLKAGKDTKKLKEAYIGGNSLEDEKLYHIISIDYLINGGDGMVAFGKSIERVDMNLKSRDALLEYVKKEYAANSPLVSKLDNRISYE